MASLKVLHVADGRRMPWKNGGGETVEVAVHPEGAGLNDMDWRVSVAAMTADAPFSAFPGIDRTLVVLEGSIALSGGLAGPVQVDARCDPFSFAGDVAYMARISSGPVRNLNVMARRSGFRHGVERLALQGAAVIAAQPTTLLFCSASAFLVGDRRIGADEFLLCTDVGPIDVVPQYPDVRGVLIRVLPL